MKKVLKIKNKTESLKLIQTWRKVENINYKSDIKAIFSTTNFVHC